MWHTVENGENVRPSAVDTTSSRVYVYVRKNIQAIEATEDFPTHYKWEELKIPKEMWEVSQKVFGHDEALDDVYSALTELAELIVEV